MSAKSMPTVPTGWKANAAVPPRCAGFGVVSYQRLLRLGQHEYVVAQLNQTHLGPLVRLAQKILASHQRCRPPRWWSVAADSVAALLIRGPDVEDC